METNISQIEKQGREFVERHSNDVDFRIKELSMQIDEINVKVDNVDREVYRMKMAKKNGSPEFSQEKLDDLKNMMKELKQKSEERQLHIQEWQKRKMGLGNQVGTLLNTVKEHDIKRIKALKIEMLPDKIIIREKKWKQEVPGIPQVESTFGEILKLDTYAEFQGGLDPLEKAEAYSIIPENNWELRILSIGKAMGLYYPELLSQHIAYTSHKKLGTEYLQKFAK